MHRALLICNSHFPGDPRELAELNGPKNDGLVLRDALTDPTTGMFERADVRLLNDADSLVAGAAIEEFYQSAQSDDTLFFYYSGHGRTRNQKLFLCVRNTIAAKLYSTALSSSTLDDIVSNSLAQVRIIVLDCCYGALFKGDEVVDKLAGEGRYVIAATSATDTAPDSPYRGEASPFTRILADGLRAKAVDRDNDGLVDLDDLFFYLDGLPFDGLAPRRSYDGSGAVPIARRPLRRSDRSKNYEEHTLKAAGSLGDDPAGLSDFLDRTVPRASFSSERVGRFRASMRQDIAESFPKQLTAVEFLLRAGLMQHGVITHTGVLLFSDSPTLTLPSAMIQCARFKGETKIDPLESKEIHGPVTDLVVQARDFVASTARLGEVPTTEGAYTEVTYSYPMVAIREIIANAIVHRDYEKHEACVQLNVFSNRIEIISPGSWEGMENTPTKNYRLSQLERPSWRRNFSLARVLTWSKLVEGVGAGLPRAVADCRAVGASEPVVAIGNGLVTVTVFPRKFGFDNSNPRITAVEQDPRQLLARRLRSLREEHWPGIRVTQPELARALGGDRPVSVPLISSWESRSSPKIPPIPRLEAYATFFATTRSVAGGEPLLLSIAELTDTERQARDEIVNELIHLRNDAHRASR